MLLLFCLSFIHKFRTLRVTVPFTLRSKLAAGGQPGRHEKIKTILSDLFRHERSVLQPKNDDCLLSLVFFFENRIEGYIRTHDEARQYAERLIELAKKYGDR